MCAQRGRHGNRLKFLSTLTMCARSSFDTVHTPPTLFRPRINAFYNLPHSSRSLSRARNKHAILTANFESRLSILDPLGGIAAFSLPLLC